MRSGGHFLYASWESKTHAYAKRCLTVGLGRGIAIATVHNRD